MILKIDISEKQLETVEKALDLYSRVLCGQLEEVQKVITYTDINRLPSVNQRKTLDYGFNLVKEILFSEIYPATYGICSQEKLPRIGAIAYDMYQIIRDVRHDEQKVFKVSKEPLLEIEKLG